MYKLSDLDQSLLELLSSNSRATIASLAKQLGVSRLTVQSHMEQLERSGVIEGYTIRWHKGFLEQQVGAYILVAVDQKRIGEVVTAFKKIAVIRLLYSISGEFDLVAELRAASTEQLDAAMDQMTQVDGVLRTQTSVLLSKKFER